MNIIKLEDIKLIQLIPPVAGSQARIEQKQVAAIQLIPTASAMVEGRYRFNTFLYDNPKKQLHNDFYYFTYNFDKAWLTEDLDLATIYLKEMDENIDAYRYGYWEYTKYLEGLSELEKVFLTKEFYDYFEENMGAYLDMLVPGGVSIDTVLSDGMPDIKHINTIISQAKKAKRKLKHE